MQHKKFCVRCGHYRSKYLCFYKDSKYSDGYNPYCKKCKTEHERERRRAIREKRLSDNKKNRECYWRHVEEYRAAKRERYAARKREAALQAERDKRREEACDSGVS